MFIDTLKIVVNIVEKENSRNFQITFSKRFVITVKFLMFELNFLV
jgi:hypothetical protein